MEENVPCAAEVTGPGIGVEGRDPVGAAGAAGGCAASPQQSEVADQRPHTRAAQRPVPTLRAQNGYCASLPSQFPTDIS